MSDHRYTTFQGLITAGLGFWLLLRVWDGTILFYINQRFVLLVLLAALGLLLLAQPIVAYLLDAALFDVPVSPRQWLGLLASLAGIFVAGTRGRAPLPAQEP